MLDCSTEYKAASLNNELISGSDMTNQILGLLIRFRQEPIVMMADIESIFFQVCVPEEHQYFLWLLWWENHNLKGEPAYDQIYVHVFGGASSPSYCNYSLKRTSIENKVDFGEEAAKL